DLTCTPALPGHRVQDPRRTLNRRVGQTDKCHDEEPTDNNLAAITEDQPSNRSQGEVLSSQTGRAESVEQRRIDAEIERAQQEHTIDHRSWQFDTRVDEFITEING